MLYYISLLTCFVFCLEDSCFNVVLVSAVHWSESAIASLLDLPSTPLCHHGALSRAPHAVQQLPTNYFTCGSVYISVPRSQFVPSAFPLLAYLQVSSLYLHLYSCSANRFICTRDSIYMLIYICFSLSDLLQSVQQTLCSFMSLQMIQCHSF